MNDDLQQAQGVQEGKADPVPSDPPKAGSPQITDSVPTASDSELDTNKAQVEPTPAQPEPTPQIPEPVIPEPAAPEPTPLEQPQSEIPGPTPLEQLETPKTLEEISGIKGQIEDTANKEYPDITDAPETKADLYSKITKIAVPIIIAAVLIGGGYLVYSFFIASSIGNPPIEQIEQPATNKLELENPLNSLKDTFEQDLQEELDKLIPAEQAQEAEGDHVPTASDSELDTNKKTEPAEEAPKKQKIPRI